MTIEVNSRSPLGRAVTAAASAPDAAAADRAYRVAMELADADTAVALAHDHVADLVRHQAKPLALKRCTEYLDRWPGDVVLRLLRAEARGALADWAGAERDALAAAAIRGPDRRARLHRVRALAAMDRGDYPLARHLFARARTSFGRAGDHAGVAAVDRDELMLGVRGGDPHAVSAVLSAGPPRTPVEYLLLAGALKRELRYEEALELLGRAEDVDPVALPLVRRERAALRRLIRLDDDERDERRVADPDRFDDWLLRVRELVVECHASLAQARAAQAAELANRAEVMLVDLRPRAETPAARASWHLAAGELELARGDLLERAQAPTAEVEATVREAAGHFECAGRLADTTATTEVRLLAFRLRGRALTRLGAVEEAVELWRTAHRLEEDIADRQRSDEVKARMSLAAGDEHDERVRAAADLVERTGPEAAAGVAVAIEAARGRTFVSAVGGVPDELPRLGDVPGACRWVRELAHDLPRDQVVWMMYATPDRVHHVLLGRRFLRYHRSGARPRPSFRRRLDGAVRAVTSFWDQRYLERSVESGEFDAALARVAELVDIGPVLAGLPAGISRVAVVAHGVLADVPVAALPIPGTGARVVHRVATSELPALAVRRPLADRSRRCRGERTLLVSPGHLPARAVGRMLTGQRATVAGLRRTAPGHHVVRVDAHGAFTANAQWLQLAPGDERGRLGPADVRAMDLHRCGTLVLGACESAVARTVGRDERLGFTRSAMWAGAAAVLAARWIAEEPVATELLDRFERYLRYLPRDAALRRAQLDVCAGRTAHAGRPRHPARWACWAVYGDAGRQTGVGPVRRWLRGKRDDRRQQHAEHY